MKTETRELMLNAERIGDILPGVLKEIRRRCEQNPNNPHFQPGRSQHATRVFEAAGNYMARQRHGRKATKLTRKA